MMLTELLAAVGMRLLRKARGDDEPAGWTMRALVEVFRRLSQPGMCVQAFATTSSDPLDPSVNLRMDQVPGLFCLSATGRPLGYLFFSPYGVREDHDLPSAFRGLLGPRQGSVQPV